ncbi:MAG: hypothetical protein ACI8ZB_000383 [Desulforhopalus sp.]|jgi:hypothetical protein
MNEALILEKLDRLSDEVRSLKSDVLLELKQEMASILRQPPIESTELPSATDDGSSNEKVLQMTQSLLTNLEQLNEVISGVKTGAELKNSEGAVVTQIYPKSVQFFTELDTDFHIDELIVLLRKALTNLDTMGEGLDMLKAGVELRDDMVPILKLMYPRLLRFLNSLYEGEFQAEELGDLLHTVLINIHTLSDLLNMIQPMTELVKEVGVLMKETDVINGMNVWLDGLQQGNGFVKLAGVAITALKRIDYTESQIEEICQVISNVKISEVKPVGPIGMIKLVNDPKVQEAFGFLFMMLQVIGSCLQTSQSGRGQKEQTSA